MIASLMITCSKYLTKNRNEKKNTVFLANLGSHAYLVVCIPQIRLNPKCMSPIIRLNPSCNRHDF